MYNEIFVHFPDYFGNHWFSICNTLKETVLNYIPLMGKHPNSFQIIGINKKINNHEDIEGK